jgi:hypothetical protein
MGNEEGGSLAMPILVKKVERILYVKFGEILSRDELTDFESLEFQIKNFSGKGQVFVFDFTLVKKVDEKLFHLFIRCQLHARSFENSRVVIIKPAVNIKAQLMQKGAIRSDEIYDSLYSLKITNNKNR